jgi:microcystin-dependent protein
MTQPFIGEIRCFGFSFAPVNWAVCNGQSVSIANFSALYSVIGTTYGGDGQTSFNLPNLQGYAPMHWGTGTGPANGLNTTIGQVQGSSNVTLLAAHEPAHTHTITAMEIGSGGEPEKTANPTTNTWLASANPGGLYDYAPPSITAQFAPNAITSVGGSQPHENMSPYLALNFCISLVGIFPSRN